MAKVWIRLGGYITADDATMERIKAGSCDALVKAIKENGFEVNGESYIPETDDESVIDSFESDPMVLTFFREIPENE